MPKHDNNSTVLCPTGYSPATFGTVTFIENKDHTDSFIFIFSLPSEVWLYSLKRRLFWSGVGVCEEGK